MEKPLLIEAWARYRPDDNSPRNAINNKGHIKRDIEVIYGDFFMAKLLTGVTQRIYLSKEERLNGMSENANKDQKISD